jgi:hypothetical protein
MFRTNRKSLEFSDRLLTFGSRRGNGGWRILRGEAIGESGSHEIQMKCKTYGGSYTYAGLSIVCVVKPEEFSCEVGVMHR